MKQQAKTLISQAATVLLVALVWLVFFELNALAFSSFEHNSRVHWIFLPAGLRLIAVLLFRERGVIGLLIGSYFTLPHAQPSDLTYELLLSVSSGIAPLLAVLLCTRLFPIQLNLSGLRGKHIIALSIACAAMNAFLLTSSMAVSGRLYGDIMQIWVIFVGDMLGAALLLLLISRLFGLINRTRALY